MTTKDIVQQTVDTIETYIEKALHAEALNEKALSDEALSAEMLAEKQGIPYSIFIAFSQPTRVLILWVI